LTVAKIDRKEYFFIIPNLLFSKAIGITAGVMARQLGADTWLSMTMGFVIGTVLMLLMVLLNSRFPDKTVIDYSAELFGKWISRILGAVLMLFFMLAFGVSANVMTMHLSEYFLPETPVIVICILYTLLCTYAVFLGVEVAMRFSFVGFIMSVLISIAMATGTVTDLKLINLLPLMDMGFTADLRGSIYIFSDLSMAILSVGFFYPMLNKKKKVMGLTFWSMALSMCMIIIWPLYETMVLGPDLMKQYVVVCMQQIRCAQLTKYLPRYELVMVSFFTFTVLVQSVAMFHCAKHSLKQITGIKKDWIMILPLSVILCLLTYFLGKDDNDYIHFLSYPYSQICVILAAGLPVLLLLTALFRGRLKKKITCG
jgi:spore germination protein KB